MHQIIRFYDSYMNRPHMTDKEFRDYEISIPRERPIVMVPCAVSLLRGIFGVPFLIYRNDISAFLSLNNVLSLLFVFVIVFACLDMLDGWLARHLNAKSDFGGVLDRLCDHFGFFWLGAFLFIAPPGNTGIPPELVIGGGYAAAVINFVLQCFRRWRKYSIRLVLVCLLIPTFCFGSYLWLFR